MLKIPLRTGRGLNDREHFRTRARRVKAEKSMIAWSIVAQGVERPALPCTVTLTRVSPSRGLDGDNLQGSLKNVRDSIATWLLIDDADPRVTWVYAQKRGPWGVEVST